MIAGKDTQIFNSGSIRLVTILAFGLFILFVSTPVEVQASNPITISRGEQIQLSAVLLTNGSFGEPLSHQVVEFFDQTYDQFIGDAITDNQGIAAVEYMFPLDHPKGDTLLNVTYRGNESFALAPSCQWIPLIITSITSLELLPAQMDLAPDDILTFSINLTDDFDCPISDAPLDIYCDELRIGNATTDYNGSSLVTIDIMNNSISLGNHRIEVTYLGDIMNYHRGTSEYFNIAIQPISTSVTPTSQIPSKFPLNQTLTLEYGLLSDEGSLQNFPVLIFADDILQGVQTSNESGYVTFNIRFDDTYSLGTHTLVILFQGSERYNTSRAVHEFLLQSNPILEILHDDQAVVNSTTVISLSITDIFYRSLPSVSGNLSDASSEYSVSFYIENTNEVKLTFPITGPIGNHTIEICVFGIYVSFSSRISLTLGVWTSPCISIHSSNIAGYSSPKQLIRLGLHLADQLGNISDVVLSYSLLGTNQTGIISTNQEGTSFLEISSPSIEGRYTILLSFNGSRIYFELPAYYNFSFMVSSRMPVQIRDFIYDMNYLLKLITVHMTIQARNGTTLEGATVELAWLDANYTATTLAGGIIHLDLAIPSSAGVYELAYDIPALDGIEYLSGAFHIIISPVDSNSSEGVGFYPLLLGMTGSLSIPVIPIIKKKSITD